MLRLREKLIKPQGLRLVSEYLLEVKAAADELALLNKPIDEDDLTLYIVNGLSPELKDIFAAFRSRDSSITFEELNEKLLEHESYLKRTDSISNPSIITTNAANKTSGSPSSRKGSWNSRSASISTPSATFSRSSNQSKPSNYKGKCQLCDQVGHFAKYCSLFIQKWQSTSPRQQNYSARSSSTPQAFDSNPIQPVQPMQQGILGPSPSFSSGSNWLMDSGASHHIANDLHNLSLHSNYEGTDEIMVGNDMIDSSQGPA